MYLLEPLLRSFNKVYPLSNPLKRALYKHLQHRVLPGKHLMLKKGQVCDSIYFVKSGILRAYSRRRGEEITTCFYQKGDVFIGRNILLDPKPSEEYLDAVVDTEVILIEREPLLRICKQFPEFTFIMNHLTEHALSNANALIALLKTKSADEKFHRLSKLYPNLRMRVKGRHLASFLNIAKETFSRVKHSKHRKFE